MKYNMAKMQRQPSQTDRLMRKLSDYNLIDDTVTRQVESLEDLFEGGAPTP